MMRSLSVTSPWRLPVDTAPAAAGTRPLPSAGAARPRPSTVEGSAGRRDAAAAGWGVRLNRQDQISVFPIIVAAKCYRWRRRSGQVPVVWRYDTRFTRGGAGRIPGGPDTFINAIGELFSIAVGFRSGKVRVG